MHPPDCQHPLDVPSGLTIRISRGRGEGHTALSAFDGALRSAGVSDFNLVQLSSVIPPGSTVVPTGPTDQLRGGFGDILYCVYACAWATTPGGEAWAGLGWTRRADDSGAGLFVEHSGATEDQLRERLTSSLSDMGERRGGGFGELDQIVADVHCHDKPVCAVVIATYHTQSWGTM